METFAPARELQTNPGFSRQRRAALRALRLASIDPPIGDLVHAFNRLPHCFTLQCCCGHFLWGQCGDPHDLRALPTVDPGELITYRIAYLAFCIDTGTAGRALLRDLESLEQVAPGYVQLGGADWFWEQQVNSYALQVEPERFKHLDQAQLAYHEALHVQDARTRFFQALGQIVTRAHEAAGTKWSGR